MMSQTVGALALRPTGNAQGGFYFLSLSTGRVLNRLRATVLPMPDNVVDQVHRMARQQRANPGQMFGIWTTGGVDYEDVDDSSDDDEDEEYAADDLDAEGSEDVEDEDGPHDYNHEDMGSIESEPSEHAADDAMDMRGIDMNTEVDANLGQRSEDVFCSDDVPPSYWTVWDEVVLHVSDIVPY